MPGEPAILPLQRAEAAPADKPRVESLLIDTMTAASMAGISARTWERLRQRGAIGPQPVHLGRLIRWRRDEIEAWFAAGCPDRATWQKRQRK